MAWGWPYTDVQVTHLPTGLRARVNEMRSQWRSREAAFRMLRGMLWRKSMGPQPLVRSYEIPDGAFTIPDLETGACIDRNKRK
jgi:hypothetical protein